MNYLQNWNLLQNMASNFQKMFALFVHNLVNYDFNQFIGFNLSVVSLDLNIEWFFATDGPKLLKLV